ncbi:hypothetical protein NP233_g4945 [Leucocoprinus birnbaumii]|uniref:Ubiquitin-like domain-containing protein n=1 Tax=Leucocoprinus birnbaumii TaxID=56174 RepID=A0AAD5YWU3_9AGAR|nr:hypothetical protein NP233_g4945 [Leucocoprinus birnbaumii]
MATPAPLVTDVEKGNLVHRETQRSSESLSYEKKESNAPVEVEGDSKYEAEATQEERPTFYNRFRPYILSLLAAVILGWWISATILPATRHRWIVQTLFAWAFILIIAFRFIPNSVVSKPVGAVWETTVQRPFYKLPYRARLGLGWACLIAIVFGSAFGFPLQDNTTYGDRAISVLGLFIFQCGFWLSSSNRSAIPWPTVVVGLFIQQAIALFVLKSGAGFSIFHWIATLAADFLSQADAGSGFFFDPETLAKHWFFVNTLGAIIFFVAFVQMMYYLGVMQWIIKNFAWFFFKLMNVSGAEAVVAAASPWIGQGESACLVRPYVDLMTRSELHLCMTSGFSTIAGSVMTAYIGLGVPPTNLVTSSVMSIPASIAISKMRLPELEEPVTRGHVTVDRGEQKGKQPANALHAFSQGAVFGLVVAGQILCNVLTVLALVATINGLLTWIGRGFGIHHLTLELIIGYIFYPVTFLLGCPRAEILRVSQLFATKLVANEFAAYLDLQAITNGSNPLSQRAYTIASYGLCGFANLGSLGIQIGVLGALAPSRGKVIANIALSAMVCGFLSTLQTAGIVEKAKGKQRAIDPLVTTNGASSSSQPAIPEDTEQLSRDLVVRFTDGVPDLTVKVEKQDLVKDVKRKIRDGRADLKDRRLRLIQSGRLLTDGTNIYALLVQLEERQQRVNMESETPGKAATTWIHCSVGPRMEKADMAEDEKEPEVQLRPVRGFDRLAVAGFSEADIANFRRQFHNQSSSNYLDMDFETEEEYDEHFRTLEEQWIDSMDGAGSAILSQSSSTNSSAMLQGTMVGFFFPILPFFFMKNQKPAVFWEDGTESDPTSNVVFSRRMQMGLVIGFLANVLFGMWRLLLDTD